MATSTTNVCAICQRAFGRGSQPSWAFRMDGSTIGLVHKTCSRGEPKVTGVICIGSSDFEESRRYGWSWYVMPHSKNPTELDKDCWIAFGEPDKREGMFEWWVTGPRHLGPDHIAKVRTRLAEMDAEFAKWGQL
ncbi:MAG: hypothetical protein KGL39_47710 [Patescibacteria group bacterium]|nr:hypothetical protein [Patescibacteria group bacterium]